MRRGLFLLLFLSYAYFYQAGGWNQNSRFALVRAITNDWSLRIDAYQGNTGDKAFFEGHYYSDKAPGLALMALLVVEPARLVYQAVGGDPETFSGLALLSWLATVFTVGLFTAWAGVVLFDLVQEWGFGTDAALFCALVFGLATPMWFLATIFIGHALSAACLVIAFAAAYGVSAEQTRAPVRPLPWSAHSEQRDRLHGLVVGLGSGWATVTEFPAAVPAVILALWVAASGLRLGRTRATRIVGWMAGSALTCAAVSMVYQYLCFGTPFHIAYSSEQGDFGGMQRGLFGITRPTWSAMSQILFSEYRGLFPLSPLMFIAPVGLWLLWRRGGTVRQASVVAAVIALYYVLFNSSYHYWEGGWSLGPRHLSPALPFLCLGLGPMWHGARRTARSGLLAAAMLSVFISLVAVSTMVQPPANVSRPFRELIWPAFRDGDLALNTQTMVHHAVDASLWRTHEDPKAAFNLGMQVGLTGHTSLLPLLAGWLLCGAWMWRHRANQVGAARAPTADVH
ncbi:MAG: hypothetical protein FJW27_05050 [Acidimicrobiia bacterium]|nr:hypothetical protein [Acidimicrobiia bacterium]